MTEQRYTELKQLVAVLGRTVRAQEVLTYEDALDLVAVVSDYAYALDTLDRYDYQQLSVEQITKALSARYTRLLTGRTFIRQLRKRLPCCFIW